MNPKNALKILAISMASFLSTSSFAEGLCSGPRPHSSCNTLNCPTGAQAPPYGYASTPARQLKRVFLRQGKASLIDEQGVDCTTKKMRHDVPGSGRTFAARGEREITECGNFSIVYWYRVWQWKGGMRNYYENEHYFVDKSGRKFDIVAIDTEDSVADVFNNAPKSYVDCQKTHKTVGNYTMRVLAGTNNILLTVADIYVYSPKTRPIYAVPQVH